ncbi:MAG: sulfoxide reductase heme-binding subunit YedZ [Acidobacteria bacterium]|nr:MAG: sulfoxide reductase heme-binding subunit YedZ [Acidobacteriota bacterium]
MKRLKVLVFLLCLAPLILLLSDLFFDRLSANPIDDITDRTGIWTLRMLMLTLAVTPIRRLTGWSSLVTFRRMLGLFGFFYAALHFLTYLVIDQFFAWDQILKDIGKRPFITVGFTSLVLLVPLAVTSTKKMIRRLGGKRWQRLHRLVYVAAIGGVIHYLWLVKADTSRPLAYGTILAFLLGFRVWFFLRKRWRRAALGTPAADPLTD